MENDAEDLITIIDGKRTYNNKVLVPSIMLWKCTVPGCTTPPKPQRRNQYKNKMHCNACANRIKSQNPELLAKRGRAISTAIKKAGSKWSDVAKLNMADEETRTKISNSMKEYCKENKEEVIKRAAQTAISNNKKTGFGTAEFSKKIWEGFTSEQKQQRINKSTIGQIRHDNQEHIKLINLRFPDFKLIEFGKINNLYQCPMDHLFYMRGGNFLKRGTCPSCSPKSSMEINLLEWIREIVPDFLQNKRVLFLDNARNGNRALEVDIYSESQNLGIELHGLFYHKTINKEEDRYSVSADYHKKKKELAEINGVRLLQFFEDEIENSLDIVKSIIKSKLNKNDYVFYAKNCEIKKVCRKERMDFLRKNHLQGPCKSFLDVGLYHENLLVSLLTFRRSKKNNKIVEISRFCNKINTTIIGGFAKLLKYSENILKTSGFEEIITYSDRRYSDGILYKNNGFIFDHFTVPDMFWVKGNARFARQISWGKTDEEMKNNKYYKIYGTGHSFWKKRLV